jgi:hypothetical protein
MRQVRVLRVLCAARGVAAGLVDPCLRAEAGLGAAAALQAAAERAVVALWPYTDRQFMLICQRIVNAGHAKTLKSFYNLLSNVNNVGVPMLAAQRGVDVSCQFKTDNDIRSRHEMVYQRLCSNLRATVGTPEGRADHVSCDCCPWWC